MEGAAPSAPCQARRGRHSLRLDRRDVTCANGGTGAGEILIAAYGPKNVLNKPAGSGFWIAAVDQSECAVQAVGLVVCKFDAQGNPTACGAAKLDEANNDIVIVAVKGS